MEAVEIKTRGNEYVMKRLQRFTSVSQSDVRPTYYFPQDTLIGSLQKGVGRHPTALPNSVLTSFVQPSRYVSSFEIQHLGFTWN